MSSVLEKIAQIEAEVSNFLVLICNLTRLLDVVDGMVKPVVNMPDNT